MHSLPPIYFYLPVNDDAMRWGLYVTGLGRATVPAGCPAYPEPGHPRLYDFNWHQGRVLPEFQIVFICDGSGEFESEITGRIPIPDCSVFFLYPGLWHRYRPLPQTGWTERWVGFNGELAHRLMDMSFFQRDLPVHPIADRATLTGLFDDLTNMAIAEPAGNSIVLSLHALGLLGKTIKAASGIRLPSALEAAPHPCSTADPVVSRALDLIWTRGHQAISVEHVAEATGVLRRTLERHFQKFVGHSVMDEIIHCRLSRAKRLLEETEMPVKVIAYLAGFADKERMRLAFAGREGLSPLEYRSRIRQKAARS
jgi:AraC-like DNA-binding protein